MKGIFIGMQTVYIHCDNVKEIIEAVNFSKQNSLKRVAIVGGKDSRMVTALLVENIENTTGSIEVGTDANLFISPRDDLDMRTNNVERPI